MTKCSKSTLFLKIGPKFALFLKIGLKFAFYSKIGSKFIVAFCSKIGPKISNVLSVADEVTISIGLAIHKLIHFSNACHETVM